MPICPDCGNDHPPGPEGCGMETRALSKDELAPPPPVEIPEDVGAMPNNRGAGRILGSYKIIQLIFISFR